MKNIVFTANDNTGMNNNVLTYYDLKMLIHQKKNSLEITSSFNLLSEFEKVKLLAYGIKVRHDNFVIKHLSQLINGDKLVDVIKKDNLTSSFQQLALAQEVKTIVTNNNNLDPNSKFNLIVQQDNDISLLEFLNLNPSFEFPRGIYNLLTSSRSKKVVKALVLSKKVDALELFRGLKISPHLQEYMIDNVLDKQQIIDSMVDVHQSLAMKLNQKISFILSQQERLMNQSEFINVQSFLNNNRHTYGGNNTNN